jgi:hypothetical protein
MCRSSSRGSSSQSHRSGRGPRPDIRRGPAVRSIQPQPRHGTELPMFRFELCGGDVSREPTLCRLFCSATLRALGASHGAPSQASRLSPRRPSSQASASGSRWPVRAPQGARDYHSIATRRGRAGRSRVNSDRQLGLFPRPLENRQDSAQLGNHVYPQGYRGFESLSLRPVFPGKTRPSASCLQNLSKNFLNGTPIEQRNGPLPCLGR